MPDAIFADPRLAPLYDIFDNERDDLLAYLHVAEELRAQHVLDVGCGTGSLAVLLAARGFRVTAADPAEASLRVARSKPGAGAVSWLSADAASLPPVAADLAVMTGNVAQVFLTDHDWSSALTGVHAALRGSGHFVFETRRPDYRAWEQWAAGPGTVRRDVPGIGRVEQRFELLDVALPYVSFRHTYTFAADGAVVTSHSTLRFRDRAEIEDDLAVHGFTTIAVRDAPDRPGREHVFIARRTEQA